MRNAHAYSLIELVLALTVLAILLGMAAPGIGRWRDQAAVVAARDELAGRIAWTRMAAASQGGATLVIDPPAGRCWTRLADGRLTGHTDLGARWRVAVTTAPSADSVLLRFDGLGIGRTASRTLQFRRGDAVAGLTVSAYGRSRPW